jgi:type IV pilus assembly protein PilW
MKRTDRDDMLPRRQHAETGLTIIELMISMALGLLIVMAATALLLSSKFAYTAQDEGTRLQETGRYALDVMTRAVRQTAYENWDRDGAPLQVHAAYSPNIVGLDAQSLKESSNGIDSPVGTSVNGSDVLALRFFGAGPGEHGDGTVLNCAGFGVPEPSSQSNAENERGWSIFYVAKGASGEPELYCKYRGKSAWKTGAIAAGVESFQVLYGIDTDGDGLPNSYANATAINALDEGLTLTGADAAAQARDRNRQTYWKRVVTVKIALLVRGAQGGGSESINAQYDLFGKEYSDANAASDPGTRIKAVDLPLSLRNRQRKLFTQTIQVRNRTAGGQT